MLTPDVGGVLSGEKKNKVIQAKVFCGLQYPSRPTGCDCTATSVAAWSPRCWQWARLSSRYALKGVSPPNLSASRLPAGCTMSLGTRESLSATFAGHLARQLVSAADKMSPNTLTGMNESLSPNTLPRYWRPVACTAPGERLPRLHATNVTL